GAETRRLEVRRGANDFFGAVRSRVVGGNRLFAGDVVAEGELLVARRKWASEVSPVDPSPLDVRQVVDDAEDREQMALGSPAKLIFRQSFRRSHDVAALRA